MPATASTASASPDPAALTAAAADPALLVPPRPVVVVTGPPRSGTTVMGQLLGYAEGAFVVHEPFNQDWGLYGVERKFPYLRGRSDAAATEAVLLHRYLRTGETPWRNLEGPLPPGSRSEERQALVTDHPGGTAIVKDPFLLCALGWSWDVLSRWPAVITLRHPAAWASSMMRRKMSPRPILRGLSVQPEIGNGVLGDILEPWLAGSVRGTIPQLALAWSAMVRMIDIQIAAGAAARVVLMEDFAADPVGIVEDLYRLLSLRAPADLGTRIRLHTEAETVVPDAAVMHELHRNSAALATAWRSIMTDSQRGRIRDICEPYAGGRYTEW